MFNVRLAGDQLMRNGCSPSCRLVSYFVLTFFFHEMSWMKSGTELSHFLRIFLPTFDLQTDAMHKLETAF